MYFKLRPYRFKLEFTTNHNRIIIVSINYLKIRERILRILIDLNKSWQFQGNAEKDYEKKNVRGKL